MTKGERERWLPAARERLIQDLMSKSSERNAEKSTVLEEEEKDL